MYFSQQKYAFAVIYWVTVTFPAIGDSNWAPDGPESPGVQKAKSDYRYSCAGEVST